MRQEASTQTRVMEVDEALLVLDLKKEGGVTKENLSEKYWGNILRNEKKGQGSQYIRAKIETAKNRLQEEYQLEVSTLKEYKDQKGGG